MTEILPAASAVRTVTLATRAAGKPGFPFYVGAVAIHGATGEIRCLVKTASGGENCLNALAALYDTVNHAGFEHD